MTAPVPPAVGLGLSSPIAPEVRADQWGLLGSRIKSFPRQLIIQVCNRRAM